MTGVADPPVPPLTRSPVRRLAHRRGDDPWLERAWERSRVLVVDGGRALVHGGRLVLIDPAAAPPGDRAFLGEDAAGTPYFAVFGPLPAHGGGAVPAGLREVGQHLDDLHGGLLLTAAALGNWHARNGYSPRTGEPTTPTEAGWARADPAGETHWPRTDPAVIVLVHDGEPGDGGRCLLGRNAAWTSPAWRRRYSCLAGFVEAGESAEAAVVREVAEEVGVPVSRPRYVGSQAWPFPGSLMLGFAAQADPDHPVRVDGAEIVEARWFTRPEVRSVCAGERDDVGLPMASSIALFLITEWLAGRLTPSAGRR